MIVFLGNIICANRTASLPEEFLDILDMTCVSMRVAAPDIKNGYVVKYDRQTVEEKTFVTALYSCDDNYDFEDINVNSVYCSKGNWIGALPECEGHDTNYDDYEENDNQSVESYDSKENKVSNDSQFASTNEHNQIEVDAKNETQNAIDNTLSNHISAKDGYESYIHEDLPEQCPADNNCDHSCKVVVNPEENIPTYVCLCSSGYSLYYDKKSCIGKLYVCSCKVRFQSIETIT